LYFNRLGHGDTEEISEPKRVEALKQICIEQMTAGAFFTMVSTRKSNAGEKPSLFNARKLARVVATRMVRSGKVDAAWYGQEQATFADVIVMCK